MYLIVGADLVATNSNKDLFVSGDLNELLGTELKDYVMGAEYRIFNLEVPLADIETPISKCGPALIAPRKTINGYKAMGVNLLTLANNHIYDQGLQGLISTCETLEDNNIAFLGVGKTSDEAKKPYCFEFAGKKIGVYGCSEHEFSIVSENSAGANPFDPLESLDHISELKKECDFVIVLYHGGKEHYRYPSPMLQKNCRKIAEKGADLVVCQHSHCIGCEEKYQGTTIVYGQGNFLFDCSTNECWNTGLLISLDENMNVQYVPLRRHNKNTVRLAIGDDAREIISGFAERSEQIKQPGFIEEKYKAFADEMMRFYLFTFSGIKPTFIYRALNKLTGHRLSSWILNRKYNRAKKLALRNFIECEAHRELILQGLKSDN